MTRYYYRKHSASNSDWFILLVFIPAILIAAAYPSFLTNLYFLVALAFITTLLAGFALLIFLWLKSRRLRKQLQTVTLSGIDHFSGVEFEQYIGEIMKAQGYGVKFTKVSGDYGVDIIAEKYQDKFAVQIKRYSYAVDRTAISDAVAGMEYYKCNKSMVVTSNYFSPGAKILAASTHCQLIDRDALSKWISDFQNHR